MASHSPQGVALGCYVLPFQGFMRLTARCLTRLAALRLCVSMQSAVLLWLAACGLEPVASSPSSPLRRSAQSADDPLLPLRSLRVFS